jgi:hypothetical protein
MYKSIFIGLAAATVLSGPVLAKPEFSGYIWTGFATYSDDDPDWNFTYALDASLSGGTDLGDVEIGYVLQFGGEISRPGKHWKAGDESVDIEIYSDFGNAGLLRFTTSDRCDSTNWISGSVISSSITSNLGRTYDDEGFYLESAFRCAGGDGSNSHFVYENSFAGIDWRLFVDHDQEYDGDYLSDGAKDPDTAQVEVEANFELGPVNVTLGTNEYADIRAEASGDIGQTPFGLYGSYQRSDLGDNRTQIILSYAPEEFEYLSVISFGYETSDFSNASSDSNAIIQASFEKNDWALDVAFDQNKDFAAEGYYTLSDQFEVGVGISRLGDTHEKSYEIGVGFSF